MQHSASVVSGGEPIARLTAVFQALSEPTRLRIMALVCRAGRDLCVCEFVDALEEAQYHVSRSLKILQKAGLVAERREGRWVHYSLPGKDAPVAVRKAIEWVCDSLAENEQIADDAGRLKHLLKVDPRELCRRQCQR